MRLIRNWNDGRYGRTKLLKQKKRDISIIMDLVVNHCSDQHEWFQKALADPDGPYADYFYFIESEKEPNNWET